MENQIEFNILQEDGYSRIYLNGNTKPDVLMIFFCGKNDLRQSTTEDILKFGKKFDNYNNLFKKFSQNFYLKTKIITETIILDLPIMNDPINPNRKIRAFFEYDEAVEWWKPNGFTGEYIEKIIEKYSKKSHEKIMDIVLKLINDFQNNKNVIFIGYSQGGRYASVILQQLQMKHNMKIGFLLILKSFLVNIYNDVNKEKYNNDISISLNKIYIHISEGDKWVNYKDAILEGEKLKKIGFDIEFHVDKELKHVVDQSSMDYLEYLLSNHYGYKNNTITPKIQNYNTKSSFYFIITAPRSLSTIFLRICLNCPNIDVYNDFLGLFATKKNGLIKDKDFDMNKSIKSLEEKLDQSIKNNKTIVFKDMASIVLYNFKDLLVKWVEKYNVKFVYLIRHPTPRFLSYKNIASVTDIFSKDYIEKTIKYNFYKPIMILYELYKGKIVVAEDIQSNPNEEFTEIFRFFGLKFNQEYLKYDSLLDIGIPEGMNKNFSDLGGKISWYENSFKSTEFKKKIVDIEELNKTIKDKAIMELLKPQENVYNFLVNERTKEKSLFSKF